MRFYDIICRIIMISDRMAAYLAVQDEFCAMKLARRLTDCFQAATEAIVKSPASALSGAWTSMLGDFLKVYEMRDYVALHDVCTLTLRPMCVRILEELRRAGQWREVLDLYSRNYEAADPSTRQMLDLYGVADASDIPDSYQLAETQTGNFTLKLVRPDRTITFHSEDNPLEEARQLADRYCDGQHSRYLLLGFGMGYLADALDKREDIVEIVVCEPDLFLLKAAFHYADLSSLLTDGKVHIVYDKKLAEFARRLSGGTSETAESRLTDASYGVVIHRPSLANIDSKQLRQRLEDYYIHDSSIRSQRRLLDGNFKRNIAELESDRQGEIRCVSDAETLRKVFAGRRVLFLAAGPSLEDHLDWLSSQSAEYTITEYGDGGVRSYPYEAAGEEYLVVCVGTVLRGLMGIGVKPDYVVMTDPQDNMLLQTAGIDTAPLSLIYIPTLYYQVPKQWQGKKYIALQQGYHLSEEYAKEHGRMLFETGGSVSTFALDVLLKLGVSEVVCLGLDLAYTDGFRHAGSGEFSGQDDSARKVKAVGGGLVATALNLDNYRLWIERRLSRRTAAERSVVLKNISRGAYIDGMENSTTFMKEGNDIDRQTADWIKGYKKGEFAHYYDLAHVFEGYGNQEREAVWAFLEKLGNDYATMVFGWECLRCNLCFERLTAYLELLKGTDVLDCYEKYYILWQMISKLFTQENVPFRVTEALYEIYNDISDAFCAQFDLEWIKERDSSFVIVTVQQFLGETHAPTKTTLDRAEVLAKEAGKNVMIVNTAEQISGQNFGLLFVTMPNYAKSLQNLQAVEYHQRSYPYYQFGQNMPDSESAAAWFAFLRERRPAYIVNIGGTSLLLDATAKLVPVLNINTVFSGLEKTKATVQACAKPASKGEQKLLALLGKTAEDVIVGRFTFPRKMQQYTFTRRELGIPEYAFVLVVMGARLTAEMSSDFLEMLNSLLSDDIFLAIIGKMENYPQRASEYPVFGAHSMYYGFQTDVLCILECCDLYVNPERVGGGSSVVEAMSKGLPAVTLPLGDVSVSAGEDFCVQDYGEMARTIQRYETDSDFYEEMSMKARQRAEYMMDSSAAFLDILEQFEEIVKRKEKEIEKD